MRKRAVTAMPKSQTTSSSCIRDVQQLVEGPHNQQIHRLGFIWDHKDGFVLLQDTVNAQTCCASSDTLCRRHNAICKAIQGCCIWNNFNSASRCCRGLQETTRAPCVNESNKSELAIQNHKGTNLFHNALIQVPHQYTLPTLRRTRERRKSWRAE